MLETIGINIFAFFMGATQIGSNVHRTLGVHHGKVGEVALTYIAISFAYWFLIEYGATKAIGPYISFSLGAMLVTCYQAWRNKKK
jgi:hypothetical protein